MIIDNRVYSEGLCCVVVQLSNYGMGSEKKGL